MTHSEGPRDFAIVLHKLEDGQLLVDLTTRSHELNTQLSHVARAVGSAKGELWLKLKYLADEGGTVQIDSEIVVKPPRVKRARTVMWMTKGDNLASENPKQQGLFPREVPAPAAVRDLPARGEEPRSV